MKKWTVKAIGIFPKFRSTMKEREELESLRRTFTFKFFAAIYATRLKRAASGQGLPVEVIIEKTA